MGGMLDIIKDTLKVGEGAISSVGGETYDQWCVCSADCRGVTGVVVNRE